MTGAAQPRPAPPPPRLKVRVRKDTVRQIKFKTFSKKNCTVRYLPPYSPDFNPIEMAIAKLKAALRKLAERTVAGLIAVLEGAAGLFKRDQCENYFETCGYEPAELPLRDTT